MVPLMLPFYLLVAHLIGDYVLQTRWQAAGKFGWSWEAMALRYRHCAGYTAAFAAVLALCRAPLLNTACFCACLFLLHFLTDAQRFPSTLGDWVGWKLLPAHERVRELQRASMTERPLMHSRMPANPWPPIGLALDQTLHLAQIAVLAAVYLV